MSAEQLGLGWEGRPDTTQPNVMNAEALKQPNQTSKLIIFHILLSKIHQKGPKYIV